MLPRFSATTRITLGLIGLLSSILLVAPLLGLLPNHKSAALLARSQLSEAVAINFSLIAKRTNEATLNAMMAALAERNPDLLSIGVRKQDGSLLIDIGNHLSTWTPMAGTSSTETQIVVPVYAGEKLWGQIEYRFRPIRSFGFLDDWLMPELVSSTLLAGIAFVFFNSYLRKVLRQLDPSRVIPNRVRSALDTLAEGLLVLDQQERVVLANQAFQRSTNTTDEMLIGKSIHTLPLVTKDDTPNASMPWTEAISSGAMVMGRLFGMQGEGKEKLTFSVSVAPINDEKGRRRGALASFEDVSRLEEKKAELKTMVQSLHESSDKIKRQNRELEWLATRDPLTGSWNRRAFFERFEAVWQASQGNAFPVSGIMVDVDHFKSVNDVHGHAMGDEVLRQVAVAIANAVSENDIVARYGGEEFAVLLPQSDIENAVAVGERIRIRISELKFEKLSVTASLGVSERSETTKIPTELLEQADKCLYVAKRNGRNQVVRWDKVPTDLVVEKAKVSRTKPEEEKADTSTIPFQVVTALISALAYRDPKTAAHCRRVADLCVAVAEGLMSLSDCYTLEIAALLHDIGKIGIPDAVLLKAGPLNADEWGAMRCNDKIGVEIVRASFANPDITAIIEHYRSHFKVPGNSKIVQGADLPLGARILAICDAYDAMNTDNVYRQRRTRDEAIAELRRCAGMQFDPELVERFAGLTRALATDFRTVNGATKELALAVGQQMEQFCKSLDKQDFPALRAMSQHLASTAAKYGVDLIAMKATELNSLLENDKELLEVLQTANELLEICRSTQTSFLTPNEVAS